MSLAKLRAAIEAQQSPARRGAGGGGGGGGGDHGHGSRNKKSVIEVSLFYFVLLIYIYVKCLSFISFGGLSHLNQLKSLVFRLLLRLLLFKLKRRKRLSKVLLLEERLLVFANF